MKRSKITPLGNHMLELEILLDRMIEEHDLQWGDIFGLIRQHLEVHRPDAREEYLDGTYPIFYYGPKESK